MNADQIKRFIESNFHDLKPEPRRNPDGWSFFYKTVIRHGINTTRIARVTQSSPNCKFKPAATARKTNNKQLSVDITGGEHQICELIEQELKVYKRNFDKSAHTLCNT